jgi:hypothetical protein
MDTVERSQKDVVNPRRESLRFNGAMWSLRVHLANSGRGNGETPRAGANVTSQRLA